jgi:hypothetical protein
MPTYTAAPRRVLADTKNNSTSERVVLSSYPLFVPPRAPVPAFLQASPARTGRHQTADRRNQLARHEGDEEVLAEQPHTDQHPEHHGEISHRDLAYDDDEPFRPIEACEPTCMPVPVTAPTR